MCFCKNNKLMYDDQNYAADTKAIAVLNMYAVIELIKDNGVFAYS